MIVALGPAMGNMCGHQVRVTYMGSNDGVQGTGKKSIVTVADNCSSWGAGDVDFSRGVWNGLTNDAALGAIDVAWCVRFYF